MVHRGARGVQGPPAGLRDPGRRAHRHGGSRGLRAAGGLPGGAPVKRYPAPPPGATIPALTGAPAKPAPASASASASTTAGRFRASVGELYRCLSSRPRWARRPGSSRPDAPRGRSTPPPRPPWPGTTRRDRLRAARHTRRRALRPPQSSASVHAPPRSADAVPFSRAAPVVFRWSRKVVTDPHCIAGLRPRSDARVAVRGFRSSDSRRGPGIRFPPGTVYSSRTSLIPTL